MKINNKGITLIEVTLSIALLSIASLMLLTSINSSSRAILRGVKLSDQSRQLAAQVETEESGAIVEESGQVIFKYNSNPQVIINGHYKTYKLDQDDTVEYTIFVK